ncbi:hypothetical protein [Pedobacter sp. ASV28]|uniref:hypothetical protein n=1 Tax=Pedobacter sp. ASV28 TaxID=2795123 RepID=UPI0018EC3909|nr:hypothetical protein [Pedobacter sp. ASV28]
MEKKIDLRENVEEALANSQVFVPQFVGFTFQESTVFSESEHAYTYLVFKNCVFEKDFLLERREFSQGIVFIGCTFKQSVRLRELNFTDSYPFFRTTSPNIHFNKCTIADELQIGGKMVSNIEIMGTQINTLSIERLKTEKSVFILQCNISELFIQRSEIGLYLNINENKVDMFDIEGLICNLVNMSRNDIKYFYTSGLEVGKSDTGRYYIGANTVQHFYFSISPYYKGYYFLKNNTVKGKSEINCYKMFFRHSVSKRERENLYQAHYKEIFRPKFFFEDNVVETTLDISSPLPFERFSLKIAPSSKGAITIPQLSCERLTISGVHQGGTLIVDLLLSKNVIIKELLNYGNIKFSNYAPLEKSTFSILYSNLGKTHFSLCDFSRGTEMEIRHSNLSEIQFSSVTWFSEKLLNSHSDYTPFRENIERYPGFYKNDKKINYDHEVYKQLKNAAQKSEEKEMTVHFRSMENRLRYRILKETVSAFNRERMLLSLNRTNDFGANWTKPILLAIAATLISYILIIASFSFPAGRGFGNSLLTLIKNLANYIFVLPQLFNPTHILGAIFDPVQYSQIRFSFVIHFIDILQRFAIAYLLVQAVIAFRKQSN